METQLFTWTGWDAQDEGAYTFYNCTLKVDIGKFKAGQEFKNIYVDYQRAYIQLDDIAYRINMSIGEELVPQST